MGLFYLENLILGMIIRERKGKKKDDSLQLFFSEYKIVLVYEKTAAERHNLKELLFVYFLNIILSIFVLIQRGK